MKTKSYHFSIGNSYPGSIGYCARVNATSKKEAVELLKDVLPSSLEVDVDLYGSGEYVEIYLNLDEITTGSIDEVDDDY